MLKVFISYASEDRERVVPYYEKLKAEGFLPWIDQCILPGQNWEYEITRNFRSANVVILFISKNSVTKRGFVQREASDAIDLMRQKLRGDIYIIPARLEQCEIPEQISDLFQYIDLDLPGAWDQIIASLRLAAEQQSIELRRGVDHGPFKVFTSTHKEEWIGKPGHDIDIDYPRFESTTHSAAARELTELFAGRAASTLIKSRQQSWKQSPEYFEDRGGAAASNGRWDDFDIVFSNNQVLSLQYRVGWYGAGAAHPNSHFETYNFYLQDRVTALELYDLFSDPEKALHKISKICIRELEKENWERSGKVADAEDVKWFNDGAGPKWENFSAFTVSRMGLTFLFAPYQVHCYAMGSWLAEVSFFDLLDVLPADGIQTKVIQLETKGSE